MMPHHCHAKGCNVKVPPRLLMCLKHWGRVPRHIQSRIWKHYRPGQEVDKKPSVEYLAVMREAIDAVAAKGDGVKQEDKKRKVRRTE